jgi:glyoxylase-like metal-dependent hydrolase (beta-lactamase superfamily II)
LLSANYCTSFGKDVNRVEKPMIFETLEVGPLGVNCFILGCAATREGVVVDPGGDVERIAGIVQRHGLKVRCIINTHGHFDHVGGNLQAVRLFGAPLLIHESDAAMLDRAAEVAQMYGMQGENSPAPDSFLAEGMEIVFGSHRMKTLHTPGHTQGGCCFYLEAEKMVITGDTLFADSIGRTDLPGGSHEQLLASIKTKLFTLPDEVTAYPGHGPKTTIGHEKRNNPYF